ncbi:hypothetical protein JIQ42_04481 [Leishmania sp. Namibia]|uniref:hypothetical protein n=1 Tax=Leishmania sp. Namibia TaxID=2802991 RepID=UPI001B489CBD|nr:hypothetical protein JIQ42_04481 [Leishmania sp. Namibia]
MGQSTSSLRSNPSSDQGVGAAAKHNESRCAGSTEPPVMELQNMPCAPTFPPAASAAEFAEVNDPKSSVNAPGNARSTAAGIPILCLDASAQCSDQLFKSLELRPAQRARALQEASKHASGILLHAPITTTVRDLKQFLLAQTALSVPANTVSSRALALHMFAIRDPLLSSVDGAAADGVSSCGSAEASSNLLLALPESMELSALSMDSQLFFFPAVGSSRTGGDPLARDHPCVSAMDSNPAALRQEDSGVEAAVAACPLADTNGIPAAGRALVLLYSREASFGFDGDDMLLLTCCVSICACIAAGICCCASAAKNRQTLNNANAKPNSANGGNRVPTYNTNGGATAYYGHPPQQEYYSSGAPGYGTRPNTYTNSYSNPLYQPLPQPNYYGGTSQYQPYNPQVNGIPMQPVTCTPSAPAPMPL